MRELNAQDAVMLTNFEISNPWHTASTIAVLLRVAC